MTDNASAYRNRDVLRVFTTHRMRHLWNRPYHPQTSSKAARFIQTALRRWAYKCPYNTSRQRNAALPASWNLYDFARPHRGHQPHPPAALLTHAARVPCSEPTTSASSRRRLPSALPIRGKGVVRERSRQRDSACGEPRSQQPRPHSADVACPDAGDGAAGDPQQLALPRRREACLVDSGPYADRQRIRVGSFDENVETGHAYPDSRRHRGLPRLGQQQADLARRGD